MCKKYVKFVAMTLTAFMFASVLGACKTKNGDNPQTIGATTGIIQKSASKATSETASKAIDTKATGINSDKTPNIETLSENTSANRDHISGDSMDNLIESGVISGDMKEETIDLKGMVITKSIWEEAHKYLDNSEIYPEYTYMARKIAELEKKYNFKLEYVLVQGGMTNYKNAIINQTMAGIKIADIIKSRSEWSFPTFVENNIIMPLDNYINYEAPVIKNSSMYNGTLWKGRHYGIYWSPNVLYGMGMLVNKDIWDREGLPDILDIIESKQWTWETYLEAAKSCTRDLNGDAIIDQWGIEAASNWALTQRMLFSNGVRVIEGVDNVNEKTVLSLDTPQSIRALQFAADLSFVNKVFVTSNSNQYKAGKIAMSMLDNYSNIEMLKLGMNSLTAPLPLGPDVDSYQHIALYNSDNMSALCQNPDIIAKIWLEVNLHWDENLQKIPEYYKLYSEQYPSDWEWNPSNQSRSVTTEREYNVVSKPQYRMYKNYYVGGHTDFAGALSRLIANPIFTGQSVSQTISSAKNELQNLIDKCYQ